MQRYVFQAVLIWLLGHWSQGVLAQKTSIPTIVITASRTAQVEEQSLSSVTVIDRQDIERQQALSLSELLQGVQGLSVSNSGGSGKLTSIFMRGTESDHVLVLVDGIKVGSATSGATPFQNIPVDQIERIEIVRGPHSSLYGSEAIGGVIQIFTRKGHGPVTPSFSFTAGSDQTYKGTATLAGSVERGWFNLGLSYTSTNGSNACSGQAGVAGCFTYEPDDDPYRNLAANLRAGIQLENGIDLEFQWLHSESDNEFDGTFVNEGEARQQVLGGHLRYSPTSNWGFVFHGGRSLDRSKNFLDGTYQSRFDTERYTASLQSDITLEANHILSLGLDYQDDRIHSDTAYAENTRDNIGGFLQYQGRIARHEARIALRTDDNEQFGGHETASLGWGYEFMSGLRLTASYGTAYKAPTFNELYYPGFGNPDLDPERSKSMEMGVSAKSLWGRWSITLYQTRIEDLIAYDAVIFMPGNVASAHIRGLEVAMDTRYLGWDISGSLSLLKPENRGSGSYCGNLLPRRAEQSLRLDLDRRLGSIGLGATLIAEGRRYDDLANSHRLAPYSLVHLRAEYGFSRDWRLKGRIENLLDEDYETATYYNQPGRGLLITLQYQP